MVTKAPQSNQAEATLATSIPAETLSQLDVIAGARGRTVEEIARWAVVEFVRTARFPGVIFVDSTGYGRKAVLRKGPAVWTVVFTAKNHDWDVERAADFLGISTDKVRTALAYYEAYPEETDTRLHDMEEFDRDPRRFCPDIQFFTVSDSGDEAPS